MFQTQKKFVILSVHGQDIDQTKVSMLLITLTHLFLKAKALNFKNNYSGFDIFVLVQS